MSRYAEKAVQNLKNAGNVEKFRKFLFDPASRGATKYDGVVTSVVEDRMNKIEALRCTYIILIVVRVSRVSFKKITGFLETAMEFS